RRGLGLEGGLDRLAGQFAGGGDGQGLDLGENLTVGGAVGRGLQLLGEQQRLLQEQGLQRGLGMGGSARGHGSSSKGCVPTKHTASEPKLPETIRAPSAKREAVCLDCPDQLSCRTRGGASPAAFADGRQCWSASDLPATHSDRVWRRSPSSSCPRSSRG